MPNVLLVEQKTAEPSLEEALQQTGFSVFKMAYSQQVIDIIRDTRPDMAVFVVETPTDAFLADLLKIDQHSPLPTLVLSNDKRLDTINKTIKAEVSAYIINDAPIPNIASIIYAAAATFKHKQALRESLEEARTQLEDRKQIDRAKAILIKTQHFSEDQAYHTLRKLAMDRNITLGEMARNVIAMAELLK